MTELEARDLKVGDMILFYDFHATGAHVYVEEVEGEIYGIDMGLVLENDGECVYIDWFAEDEDSSEILIEYDIWDVIEKV